MEVREPLTEVTPTLRYLSEITVCRLRPPWGRGARVPCDGALLPRS